MLHRFRVATPAPRCSLRRFAGRAIPDSTITTTTTIVFVRLRASASLRPSAPPATAPATRPSTCSRHRTGLLCTLQTTLASDTVHTKIF